MTSRKRKTIEEFFSPTSGGRSTSQPHLVGFSAIRTDHVVEEIHGPSVTDHSEKRKGQFSWYLAERERKIKAKKINSDVYFNVLHPSSRHADPSSAIPSSEENLVKEEISLFNAAPGDDENSQFVNELCAINACTLTSRQKRRNQHKRTNGKDCAEKDSKIPLEIEVKKEETQEKSKLASGDDDFVAELCEIANRSPRRIAPSFVELTSEKENLKRKKVVNFDIFENVVVYFTGKMGEISSLHLGNLLRTYGGNFTPFFSINRVTHLVCTKLCASKADKFLRVGHCKIRVVTPDWIIQSIKLGKRLPEVDFRAEQVMDKNSIVNYTESANVDTNEIANGRANRTLKQ